MLVQTTRSIEKTTRTARQMAEVQRDSYEALAENLAAAQRRTMGLAEDGLKFMRLQEESARAAQEWFAGGVKLLQLQQRNQAAGGLQDAHPGLGGGLQGHLRPLRTLRGRPEDDPAGRPAGVGGHRAGSP